MSDYSRTEDKRFTRQLRELSQNLNAESFKAISPGLGLGKLESYSRAHLNQDLASQSVSKSGDGVRRDLTTEHHYSGSSSTDANTVQLFDKSCEPSDRTTKPLTTTRHSSGRASSEQLLSRQLPSEQLLSGQFSSERCLSERQQTWKLAHGNCPDQNVSVIGTVGRLALETSFDLALVLSAAALICLVAGWQGSQYSDALIPWQVPKVIASRTYLEMGAGLLGLFSAYLGVFHLLVGGSLGGLLFSSRHRKLTRSMGPAGSNLNSAGSVELHS